MRGASIFLVLLAGGIFLSALAQIPRGTQARQHPSMTFYRDTPEGKRLDFVVNGSSAGNLSERNVLVEDFVLKSFRNGDPRLTNFIAKAPQCAVDVSNNVASDAGPIQIYTPPTNLVINGVMTPSTNLFVEGVGFLFTQSNHFLIISNDVKTRVVKSMMKTSILAGPESNPAAAPSPAKAGQLVRIFADSGQFDFNSNVVDYAGNVHMIDPQLDLTSDLLTIRFTTNGAVESILARQNVVLTTTNNGRATGDVGFYYVTNGMEMMRLMKNAAWRNGDQSAKAEEFTYDSTRHFLTGRGQVKVRWPEAANSNSSSRPINAAAQAGTNGSFRELFADFATMQFPLTNGPVKSMHARGNVIIVNDVDQSKAMADEADYERATDSVELTGNPVWWNTNMEVKAKVLVAGLGAKTYHAQTNAHFKMRTGSGSAGPGAAVGGHSTNQWVFISSADIEYHTNQAVFYRNVETRLIDNGQLQDTLYCNLLTLDLTNSKVEDAFAFGNVHGKTEPDTNGVIKTIVCEQLNAFLSITTGLIKTIDAYTNVVIEEIGTGPAAPRNKLAADTVHAKFLPTTNRLEQAVAVRNVVLDQIKAGQATHATSDRAVYTTGATDVVKLTGTPLAHTQSYIITHSDFMIWLPKSNIFRAFGPYKIVPTRLAAVQAPP